MRDHRAGSVISGRLRFGIQRAIIGCCAGVRYAVVVQGGPHGLWQQDITDLLAGRDRHQILDLLDVNPPAFADRRPCSY